MLDAGDWILGAGYLFGEAILWQAETPALLDAGFGIEYMLLKMLQLAL